MARRRPIALVSLVGLLLVTPALATEGTGRSVPTPAERAGQRAQIALTGIADGIADVEAAIDEVGQAIGQIERELSPLETELRAADATFETERRRVLRAAQGASSFVGEWLPGPAPTMEELSEPLELIATALHDGDEYRVWLRAQTGTLTAHNAEIDRLQAEALRSRTSLGTALAELRRTLAVATQAEWRAGGEGGGLVDRLRSALARAQVAELSARRLEGRIRAASVEARGQQDSLRVGLRAARHAEDALIEGMIAADSTIVGMLADVLGASPWGPFDPDGVLGVCPVDMPNAYTDNWGVPRYSGGYHAHQGIDVFAPEGTPIRAPFPGLAVTAENELGGLAVKVIGEAGYVYNAHLSAYGQLGEVETGDVIGYVGNTGNARYSAPHDHFEWHPGGGPAVNPFDALNAACRPAA